MAREKKIRPDFSDYVIHFTTSRLCDRQQVRGHGETAKGDKGLNRSRQDSDHGQLSEGREVLANAHFVVW